MAADGAPGIRFGNISLRREGEAVDVTFDLRWTGSWGPGQRGPGFSDRNWDAAWVFFKYRFTDKWLVPCADAPAADELALACDFGNAPALLAVIGAALASQGTSVRWAPPGGAAQSPRPILRARSPGQAWTLDVRDRPDGPAYRILVERQDSQGGFVLSTVQRWRHTRVVAVTSAPEGAVVDLAEDQAGVFIHRAPGAPPLPGGVADYRRLTLRCELRDLPLSVVADSLELWPFGLEMVYVPEEPFWLGDPMPPTQKRAPRNAFFDALAPEQSPNRAYRVDSEAGIRVGPPPRTRPPGVDKMLWYDNDDDARGAGDHHLLHGQDYKLRTEKQEEGLIPVTYPKGYAAYYVMKHQVSQGDYASFINALDGGNSGGKSEGYGQLVRYAWDGAGSSRGTIQIPNPSSHTRAAWRPLRANNHMCWADAVAFAAWAALRPMSELEYEKACRGPKEPVPSEFAWGESPEESARHKSLAEVILGEEDGTETVVGCCNLDRAEKPFTGGDGGCGPVRGDGFDRRGRAHQPALSTTAVRLSAPAAKEKDEPWLTEREDRGLSYYGIASLTGNLWELCVTVATREGRAFRGTHGSGELTEYGEAPCDELDWPDQTARSVSWRGGSWYTHWKRGFIAARPYGNGAPGFFLRSHDAGFRAVRSAALAPTARVRGAGWRATLRNPVKLLPWLDPQRAGSRVDDKVSAALLDMRPEEYRATKEEKRFNAYNIARNLSEDPELRRRVEALTLPPGASLVGIGDGIADDHQSFLDILRHLVALLRPDEDLRVVNAGMIDETTTDLVTGFAHLLAARAASAAGSPLLVLCHAGLGDARRFADPRLAAAAGLDRPRVSPDETKANLRALRALGQALPGGPALWVWMTQTNVNEDDAAEVQPGVKMRLLNADVDAVAAVIRAVAAEHGDQVIDLEAVRAARPANAPAWLGARGQHLTLPAHHSLIPAVLEAIERAFPPGGDVRSS
jgi:formylglycine-generating enzyme required for sulfatase activity